VGRTSLGDRLPIAVQPDAVDLQLEGRPDIVEEALSDVQDLLPAGAVAGAEGQPMLGVGLVGAGVLRGDGAIDLQAVTPHRLRQQIPVPRWRGSPGGSPAPRNAFRPSTVSGKGGQLGRLSAKRLASASDRETPKRAAVARALSIRISRYRR
jgi:hypothetical protein